MAHNKIHKRSQEIEDAIRHADQSERTPHVPYRGSDRTPNVRSRGSDSDVAASQARETAASNKRLMDAYHKAYGAKNRQPKGEVQKARERGVGGKGSRYL